MATHSAKGSCAPREVGSDLIFSHELASISNSAHGLGAGRYLRRAGNRCFSISIHLLPYSSEMLSCKVSIRNVSKFVIWRRYTNLDDFNV